MRVWRGKMMLLGAMLGTAAGCRTPSLSVHVPPISPVEQTSQPELPIVMPTPIEPASGSLPTLDLNGPLPSVNLGQFRGLTEHECQCLAAAYSPLAKQLERENQHPRVVVDAAQKRIHKSKQPCPTPTDSTDDFSAELRRLAAATERNRAAASALESYFKLADAEGRTELLAYGLKSFDELRAQSDLGRAAGLPGIPTVEEFVRDRAKLLLDAEAAEAGIRLLNVDLKTKLGLSVKDDSRLWPMMPFAQNPTPIDAEIAVATALEQRPDLQFLRALHAGLTTQTLPIVREQLQSLNPLLGLDAATLAQLTAPPIASRFLTKRIEDIQTMLKPAADAELALRKQQLFDLIAERERQVAAEVRSAIVQQDSAARRVAIAQANVESYLPKLAEARKKNKPLDLLPIELEWIKARAAVMVELTAWHQWRVKTTAAIGRLGWECAPIAVE